jgi:hypothetical protein
MLPIRLWPREVKAPQQSGVEALLLPATMELRNWAGLTVKMPPPRMVEVLLVTVPLFKVRLEKL